jgi:CBS domain-containing protein
MLRAKDVMQSRVTQVGETDPLLSVHRLFCDEEISGAPVVGETGDVLGVVTIRDLLRDHREATDRPANELHYFRDGLMVDFMESRSTNPNDFDALACRTVEDVMSPDVISVTPDSPIEEIAERMLANRVHRVLVLDPSETGGSLVGIVSGFDLLQLLT